MHITTDTSLCIGSGQCTLAAPEVFDQGDDDALVVVTDPSPPESARAAVEEAIRRCPTQSISLDTAEFSR